MTAKELIDKLGQNTKENLWDIIIDGKEYNEDDKENIPEHLNSQVHKWELDYGICFFNDTPTTEIYTVDYEPYFFEEYDGQ